MEDEKAAELSQEPAPEEEPKSQEHEQEEADGRPAEAETDGEGGEQEPADDPEAEAEKSEAERYKSIARNKEKKLKRTARELRETQQKLRALEQARSEPTKADPAPKPEDFDDREDFLVAKAKYEIRQEQAAGERTSKEDRAKDEAARAWQDFQGHCDDWADKPDDFEEVIHDDDLSITSDMYAAIMEAGAEGPKIAYHLGENPDEAARISKLSPLGQARAIGKLEAQLSQPRKPAKRPSKAPPPVTPIAGSGDSVTPDLGKLSPEEYRKQRGYPPLTRP